MDPEDFSNSSPGRLVPTTAYERFDRGGRLDSRPASGMAFVPELLPPQTDKGDLLARVIEPLSAAERGIGRLEGLASDVSVGRLLAAPLMRREASLSSKIENTIATPRDLTLFEAGEPPARRDTIEVYNYLKALDHGLRSPLPICMRLVRDMHEKLLQEVRGGDQRPGRVRDMQNWIGGDPSDFGSARFVPPPPGHALRSLLENLEQYWNEPQGNLPPLIRVAVAHYQFEAIHPFGDGNGRLGRLIVALSIMRAGLLSQPLLYVSHYFEKNRTRYCDLLLRVSTHGDWAAWIHFFLEALVDHADDACRRLDRLKEERRRVHESLSTVKAGPRVLPLVDHLIEHQWTTAARARELMGVSDPTARADLGKLEKIGFVRPVATGGSRGQAWVASTILDIMGEDIEASIGG